MRRNYMVNIKDAINEVYMVDEVYAVDEVYMEDKMKVGGSSRSNSTGPWRI